MFPELIIDESVNFEIVEYLRDNGFNVYPIIEKNRGCSDGEVISIVKERKGVLLTEDKDFGEWVYVHRERIGVIFLRYKIEELMDIKKAVISVLKKFEGKISGKFVVITSKKIRIRNI